MSGPNTIATQDSARDQAVAWLVRIQSDRATGDDWVALTAWLAESEVHLAAYEAVEQLSEQVEAAAPDLMSALRRPSAQIIPLSARPATPPRRPTWTIAVLSAASIAAAAVLAGPILWRGYQGSLEVYHTKTGESRAVALSDGTRIRLDAASTLSARIGWGARRVRLSDGEATFDVARDTRRPFQIAVGDQTVRVVGTEFNIRHYDKSTLITVRRGVVDVYQTGDPTAPTMRLVKGWALSHQEGSSASQVLKADPDAAFAWTQGRLICADQPLSQIVAYLNRRYTVPIRLSDAAAKLRFSGVLALGDQQEVTRNLAQYLSLSEQRSAREILLR